MKPKLMNCGADTFIMLMVDLWKFHIENNSKFPHPSLSYSIKYATDLLSP